MTFQQRLKAVRVWVTWPLEGRVPGRGNSTYKGLFKKWSDELWAQSADHLRERAGDEVRGVTENCHRPWNTLWIILKTWVFILKYGKPLEGTRQRNNGFWIFILRESQWLLDGEQASGKWARTEAKSSVGKLLAVILVRVDGDLVVRKLRSRGLDHKSPNSDSGGLEPRGASLPLKHLPPWSLKDGEEATLQTLPLPLRTVQNYVTLSHISHLWSRYWCDWVFSLTTPQELFTCQ